ncbi:MAG: carbonic anhydrase [Acidobacteria bacterium]|nr:carbonic anhydrase [Acidobacteriota bacterium]
MPLPRDIAPCDLDAPPRRRLAVLTCMDARIDLDALLELELGDAHVIRNAGAIATTDVIRTLAASQRLLGTEEIIVVQHTDCGIHRMDPKAFAAEVTAETGVEVDWTVPSTDSPQTTLALTLEILRAAPEIPKRDRISGYVLELESGRLLNPAGQ